jgi:hypothetical protein
VPFLRVIRDKRGYETTYLMHWYREGNRQRSRILYVFRTPGGVRVGRAALEPEVLRQIEQRYPDIAFDWPVVRDNQQIVDSTPDLRPRRERRPKRDDEETDAPQQASAPAAPARIRERKPDAAPPETATSAQPPPVPPRPPIPSAIEGATPDEQIEFLATWYPIVRDRISTRTADPARRELLLAVAERLNPTAWTDADQITSGLQAAGEALERLSAVLGKHRRRARRRPTDVGPAEAPIPQS